MSRPSDPDSPSPRPLLRQDLEALYTKTFGGLETLSIGGTLKGPEHATTVPSARTRAQQPLSPGFDVVEEIGRGGMGIVFRSRQRSLDREVALKRVHSNVDSDSTRGQFVSEALITGWLDHPNIVPVHDLSVSDDGEVSLAMKLVGGRSWAELLTDRRDDREWLSQQLDILLSVSNALAFAHSRRILHRDLKPENVMVGEYGEVLLMDWGIAIDFADEPSGKTMHRSEVTGPAGTPLYMAPELAEGRASAQGPVTDVYLLGAVLHEVLTGRPPHLGETLLDVLTAAAESTPPEFDASVPEGLQEICRTAMARDPADRYPTVTAFQGAVRDYLRHRESAWIAEDAATALDRCRGVRVRADLDEVSRNRLYGDFGAAVAGFQQARALWAENRRAEIGERDARLAYAQAALTLGDFGLADTQLEPLAEMGDGDAQALMRKNASAREARLRASRTNRNLRWGLLGLGAVLLVGGTFAWGMIRQEEARGQERAWTARRNQAEGFYQRGIEAMGQRSFEAAAAYFARALEIAPEAEMPGEYPSTWAEPGWPQHAEVGLRHAVAQLGPRAATWPESGGLVEALAVDSADRGRVAGLGPDGRITVWNARDGAITVIEPSGLDDDLRPMWIGFGRDREEVWTGFAPRRSMQKNVVQRADLRTGKVETVFSSGLVATVSGLRGTSAKLMALDVTSNRPQALLRTKEPRVVEVHYLDALGGTEELVCPMPPGTHIESLWMDRDRGRCAVGASDGTVFVYAVIGSDLQYTRTIRAHQDGVTALAMDRQGYVLLTGSADGRVRLWEVSSGRLLRQFEGLAGGGGVHAVGLHYPGDQPFAIAAGEDRRAVTWGLRYGFGAQKLRYMDEDAAANERGPVSALTMSDDGRYVAAATGVRQQLEWIVVGAGMGNPGQSAVVWDLEDGALPVEGPEPARKIRRLWFEDGAAAISSLAGSQWQRWDRATGEVIEAQDLPAGRAFPQHGIVVRYSPLVAAANALNPGVPVLSGALTRDGVQFLDDGRFVPFSDAGGAVVADVAIDADGTRLITAEYSGRAVVRALPSLDVVAELPGGTPTAAALSADGRYALIVREGAAVAELWEVDAAAKVREWFCGTARVRELQFSPDGTLALFVTGATEPQVVVHDVRSGARLHRFEPAVLTHVSLFEKLTRFVDQDRTMERAAFDPSGTRVLTHLGPNPVVWTLLGGDDARPITPDALDAVYSRIGMRVAREGAGSGALVPLAQRPAAR